MGRDVIVVEGSVGSIEMLCALVGALPPRPEVCIPLVRRNDECEKDPVARARVIRRALEGRVHSMLPTLESEDHR